jgi:hypothetical protein
LGQDHQRARIANPENIDMAEIVSLSKVRKAQRRVEQVQEAAENRVRHGRTKAQKANDRRAEERRKTLLDGVKREGDA